MGDDCHGYGFAILMTSGMTCALLIFDLATRFMVKRREEEEKRKEEQRQEYLKQESPHIPQVAAYGFEPIS
jgi:hypothetical protein